MYIIETRRSEVPWRWLVLLGLMGVPYIMMFFIAAGDGALLSLSLRKYLESPFWINVILSCDIAFNVIVGATCLYLSDRIWTRYGRRKPFVLVSWGSISLCMALIPFAGEAGPLILLIVILFAAMDVGTTADMLVIEVIPPHQRGRYEALKGIYLHILIIIFGLGIQGRFFETYEVDGVGFTGQEAIFILGAGLILLGAIALVLFVRENRPPEADAEQDAAHEIKKGWAIFRPLRAIFLERSLWPIYLLAFSLTLVQVNLGPLGALLVTEQWGYSLQDIGVNLTIGSTINIFLLMGIGYLADRGNRLFMFASGVFCYVVLVIAYYLFVEVLLPDGRPMIWMMVAFGFCQSFCNLFVMTNFNPLCFDYIPRQMIGTAQAGINMVRSATRWIAMIGVGAWVQWYSSNFAEEGVTDYFSGYLYVAFLGIIGCLFLVYFIRKVRRGELRRVGREGYDEPPTGRAT